MADVDTGTVWRFMNLFQGNERGHGFGNRSGPKFNPVTGKWKYEPGGIGWEAGKPEIKEFQEHLTEVRALGTSGLLDDGTTWRGELDIDDYDIDYSDLMGRVKGSGFPLVACRTKSGGVRLIAFFTEPIDTVMVRSVLGYWRGALGLGNCEIFPKQDKLLAKDDCPSWTFLPYGPTFGVFAEQCGMNVQGGALTLVEWLEVCEGTRTSRVVFSRFADVARGDRDESGEAPRKGVSKTGRWSQKEGYSQTVNDTFAGGPPCLKTLAILHAPSYQHNFLFSCGVFLKKKYPDNWEEAMRWVNTQVLIPVGEVGKLEEIIKDHKFKRTKPYNYLCKDEPIERFCISEACRKMPYGVGHDAGPFGIELGMTIIDRVPKIFIVNAGTYRVSMSGEDLLNIRRYQIKCVDSGIEFPNRMKEVEWFDIVRKARDEATVIVPPDILRTDIAEIQMLEHYFGIRIPGSVRRWGQRYLEGKEGDDVRINAEAQEIYFKANRLIATCVRQLGLRGREEDKLRIFITNNCAHHRGQGPGHRDFYRYYWTVKWSVFDQETIEKWVYPEAQNVNS